jgi:sulfide dehydrogenase cytochrome subunit
MRTAVFILSAAWGLLAAAAAAGAQERDVSLLAQACMSCHGADGRSLGAIPALAGQDRQVMASLLKDYASGAVKGTAMNFIAKAYTPDQIDALATFFSTRK